MRIREDRVRQIADRITDVLYDEEMLDFEGKLEALTVRIERVILDDLAFADRIDQEATERLKTYSRDIPTGSTEWVILHEKTKEELAIKYNYYLH